MKLTAILILAFALGMYAMHLLLATVQAALETMGAVA